MYRRHAYTLCAVGVLADCLDVHTRTIELDGSLHLGAGVSNLTTVMIDVTVTTVVPIALPGLNMLTICELTLVH
jgi:hypothetical protein